MHVRPSDVLLSHKFSLDITRVTFFLGIRNGNSRKLRLRNEKKRKKPIGKSIRYTILTPSVPSLSSNTLPSPSLWLIYLLFCCCFNSSPSSVPIRIFSNTPCRIFCPHNFPHTHIISISFNCLSFHRSNLFRSQTFQPYIIFLIPLCNLQLPFRS